VSKRSPIAVHHARDDEAIEWIVADRRRDAFTGADEIVVLPALSAREEEGWARRLSPRRSLFHEELFTGSF